MWRQQTGHPAGTPYFLGLKRLGDSITAATGGRIVVESFPAGAVVPTFKEYDGVNQGILNAGICPPFHVKEVTGKATPLFMNRAAGPEPIGQYIWLMQGGGLELYQELIAPKLPNLMYLKGAGFIGTPEVFCHSKIKFEKPEDLKGRKMRTAGDGGEVLKKMGVSTVMMPHEEIYESMQRGAIDMAESGGPQFNWDLAYQEVAPYMYLGTLRQPCEWLGYAINRQSWAALTPELQGIVHAAVRADAMVYYNETIIKDAATVQKFRDYGNTVLAVPAAVKEVFRAKAKEFYAEVSADDPFMQKALKSMDDFMALYYGYTGTWD